VQRNHLILWQTGCLLTFVAGSACAAASGAPQTERLLAGGAEAVRIVCFGDSITGVYYHTGGLRAWPELLELALRQEFPKAAVKVFNAGISGNTTTAALVRMQRDVLDRKPHLVVAMFGMNDLAYGPADAAKDAAQKAAYRANLEEIVSRSRAAGAEVLLMTPNSVYPEAAPARPPERLAEFAGSLRDVGAALNVPVVDAFAEYERLRRDDVGRWRQMMSETIHPSQSGHQVFAELVAGAICGRAVVLRGLAPSQPCLRHTATALKAGGPVTVVVADTVQDDVCAALRAAVPGVELVPVVWPVKGQSLAQLEAWAKGIRQQAKRVLVVGSFSPEAVVCSASEEAFVRQAAWVANHALAFGRREWDVVFVAPTVAGPDLTPEQRAGAALVQGMVEAHDLVWVEPPGADSTARQAALRDWFRRELEASR
jgi:lysophospholipase L1-like esterase